MKTNLKLIGLLFVVSVSLVTITGCNNDDFFGLDYQYGDDIDISVSDGLLTTNRITLSSLNTANWTEDDYLSFSTAVERIGVSFSESKQKYVFSEKNGSRINVSDSLYNKVIEMFENTNTIIASSNKITRKKNLSREQGGIIPDCVPAAIAHMNHQNAPTYDEAISRCNQLFPSWIQNGGVPINSVQSFIEEYVAVARYTSILSNTIGDHYMPNYVLRIYSGTHAVNAYNYNYSYYAGKIIYYHDYSQSSRGDGALFASQMYDMFVYR